jgi:hypothetical protein
MKINDAALATLLDSREGPVGQHVEAQVQAVTDQAKENVQKIMHRVPGVEDSVGYDVQEGLRFIIGISDNGDIERYLALKAARETTSGWLSGALSVVRG